MQYTELKSWLNEFPFLRNPRNGEKTLQDLNKEVEGLLIQVKRLDENILNKIPFTYYWDGSMGVTDDEESIDFILKDGRIIKNAVRSGGVSGSNYAHTGKHKWSGQTVLDAIIEKNVIDDLLYIVYYEDKYSNWNQSTDENSLKITIFKLPKNVTIRELAEKYIMETERRIKEQTNF